MVAEHFFAAARAGDRRAFNRTVDLRDDAATNRVDQVFTSLAQLPLKRLEVRLRPETRPLGSAGWLQAAQLTWQLADDRGPAEHRLWLTFVPSSAGARIAAITDEPDGTQLGQQPIWWNEPVTTAHDSGVTVLVGRGEAAQTWLRRGIHALRDVRAALPPGTEPTQLTLVLEVPGTERAVERVAGVEAGTYAELAAVTLVEGPGADGALRILVNPESRLSAAGLDYVLTHEAVHVATASPTSPAPLWAVEGLAEYVASVTHPRLRSTVLDPLRALAEDPTELPGDARFADRSAQIATTYAEAWSVWAYLADHWSGRDLSRLYVALDHGQSLAEAAPAVLGVPEATLRHGWVRFVAAERRRT